VNMLVRHMTSDRKQQVEPRWAHTELVVVVVVQRQLLTETYVSDRKVNTPVGHMLVPENSKFAKFITTEQSSSIFGCSFLARLL
jgi:hypothetical protein